MATQPDENWANIEPGIQDLIERFQQDDVDLFLDQYVNSSPGEAPLYTPLYTLQPSTADGLDDSTSLVSGPQEPGLTRGGSTLPFSHHAQTCPTLGRPFGEPQLSHHGTYPAQPQPRESCDDWSAPQVDLQFIGQGPGIHDQCLVSFPPVHLQDEDLPTYLTPTTFGYNIPLPGVAAANVSATSLPFVGRSSSGGLSRARMSSLGIPSAIGSPMSVAGASSQPMARGRSNPLPEQKRAKAAVMRNTKACMRCRIRHVECDEGQPCMQCAKDFPRYPDVCDRARLVEMLPGEDRPGLWLPDPDNTIVPGASGQPYDNPVQVTVTFDGGFDRRSPHLRLTIQEYYTTNNVQDGLAQVDHSSYFPPPFATLGTVPMSTNGNWPGTSPNSHYYTSDQTRYFLAPQTQPPTAVLLRWIEPQISWEQAFAGFSFEAAIQNFVFALRDRPLPLPPDIGPIGAGGGGGRGGRGKKGGGRKRSGSSADRLPAALRLLRNVCELSCWERLWRAPALYYVQQGRLPATVLRELKDVASAALGSCERRVMAELDELLVTGIKGIEVPVLACLWQIILIYRRLIRAYSERLREPAAWAAGWDAASEGQQCLSGALSTVTHLYRLILVKYAAYFGSSSPIFPRPRHRSTSDLLAGNERLQRAWDHVRACREGFYRELHASTEASDVLLTALVADVEEDLERRRRRGRRES